MAETIRLLAVSKDSSFWDLQGLTTQSGSTTVSTPGSTLSGPASANTAVQLVVSPVNFSCYIPDQSYLAYGFQVNADSSVATAPGSPYFAGSYTKAQSPTTTSDGAYYLTAMSNDTKFYMATIDVNTAALETLVTTTLPNSGTAKATCVVTHPKVGNQFWVVDNGNGVVLCYSIASGTITLNATLSLSNVVCACMDNTGTFLYALTTGGTIQAYQINPDGTLSASNSLNGGSGDSVLWAGGALYCWSSGVHAAGSAVITRVVVPGDGTLSAGGSVSVTNGLQAYGAGSFPPPFVVKPSNDFLFAASGVDGQGFNHIVTINLPAMTVASSSSAVNSGGGVPVFVAMDALGLEVFATGFTVGF